METKARRVIPARATLKQLCNLKRDHKDFQNFCLMTDSVTVWLSEQRTGEDRTQHFEISRKRFNRLLEWYLGAKP